MYMCEKQTSKILTEPEKSGRYTRYIHTHSSHENEIQFQLSSHVNAFGRTRLFAYLNKHEHNTIDDEEWRKTPYNSVSMIGISLPLLYSLSPYLLDIDVCCTCETNTLTSWSIHINIAFLLLSRNESFSFSLSDNLTPHTIKSILFRLLSNCLFDTVVEMLQLHL